jgi:CheY-like chemotaxis protein
MTEGMTKLRESPHVAALQVVSNEIYETQAEPQSCNVLVVDDNKESADSLAMFVSMLGYDAFVSYSGQEAVELTQTFAPDLILLDLIMPGLDGFDVLEQLRASKRCEHTTIIAMTGYVGEEVRRRSFAAGFDDHLTKPINSVLLEELLQQCEKKCNDSEH